MQHSDPVERVVEAMVISITEIPDDPHLEELFRMLTSLFRTYAIPEHSIVVPGPFRCDDRN